MTIGIGVMLFGVSVQVGPAPRCTNGLVSPAATRVGAGGADSRLPLARSGLARRDAGLARPTPCPGSDFSRDAALLALAADGRPQAGGYDEAAAAGDVVVAQVVRCAIHAPAPATSRHTTER